MNYIKIAKETINITKNGSYVWNDIKVLLPENLEEVVVYSPEEGADLLLQSPRPSGEMCHFSVVNEDSFQAARRFDNGFVMNFANAHNPGGGFLLGATAQEEALCRCSTLYASITSQAAGQMYQYNNTHISSVESDYMLYSPSVCVFRDENCSLLREPFMTSVITIAAPNRRGAAVFASRKTIQETMLRRIRIMLCIAAKKGHKNLILGAWGCGAFGNNPAEVAGYFKTVLVEEEYGRFFEEVCFAVYGNTDGRNIGAFREKFVERK